MMWWQCNMRAPAGKCASDAAPDHVNRADRDVPATFGAGILAATPMYKFAVAATYERLTHDGSR